nr:hypothetical protein [Tanacetum cinerariifolium]
MLGSCKKSKKIEALKGCLFAETKREEGEGKFTVFTHASNCINSYPRFTQVIVDHFMNENPDIPRSPHEHYHIIENDEVVKLIFNSRKNKEGEGMTLSAHRTPNHVTTQGESRAPRKPTVIRLRVRSQRNPKMPIPTAVEIDIDNLDEATRLSIGTQRSLEDLEAQYLDVKKNVDVLIIHDDDEEELAGDALIRRKRENGKGIEEIRNTPPPTPIRSARTHIVPLSTDNVYSFLRDYMSNNIIHVHPTQADSSFTQDLQYQMYLKMKDDEQVHNAGLSIWWSLKIKFEKHAPHAALCRIAAVRTRDHEDHHDDDDARPIDGFGTYDDEVPFEEVSPELLEEILKEVDEAQMQKAVNDMLRKYGSSGPKKYVPSLHKYPAVPFLENDLKELISRWVSKRVKRRQEKKRDNPDEVYSESKIVEVVRTLYELGYEYKYIADIVVRRVNGKFGAFLESDYKHLYKNDIEDLYLMCINGKVKEYRETSLL